MVPTADAVNDLRDALSRRELAVIIGTGVTASATGNVATASWSGLVLDAIDRCESTKLRSPEWADRARQDVHSEFDFDLIVAAEKATDGLGGRRGPEYRRWLRDSVGSLQVSDASILESLAGLGRAGALVATTNYDGLVADALGWEAVTWRDTVRLQSVLRGREEAVVHLHGYWRDPESVVFGASSYADVLSTPGVAAFLKTAVYARTLLFVGFGAGLHDPNFSALRQWMRRELSGSEFKHYRLVRESDLASVVHSPEEGIESIAYGKERGDLAPFLAAITSGLASKGIRGLGLMPERPRASEIRHGRISVPPGFPSDVFVERLRSAAAQLSQVVSLADAEDEEEAAVAAGGGPKLESYRRFAFLFADELAQVSYAVQRADDLEAESVVEMARWAERLLSIATAR